MRSIFLVLVAAYSVASNADEQHARRRLGQAKQTNLHRGVNAKYMGLDSEVDIDVKNQVQRRHLMVHGNDGDEYPMSMSMSMSMDLMMSMSMRQGMVYSMHCVHQLIKISFSNLSRFSVSQNG